MIVRPSNRILSHAELQANRTSHGSPFFARHGFSVIELLIVLAILTLVSAFVVPALTGPLDRSRLRSGAVAVQSAWGKARSLAIREGMSMTFRCRQGGRHWKIERDRGRIQPTSGLDSHSPTRFSADDDRGNGGQEADRRHPGNLVREGWLPEGVTFAGLTLDSPSTRREDEFGNRDRDQPPRNSAPERWSEPLKFSPDGHSQDALVSIAGANDFMVQVKIRGLTSNVSFSAPFHRKPAENRFGGRP
jgi:prepilin-type N-terminal cleavage/methylation domain-containing protein